MKKTLISLLLIAAMILPCALAETGIPGAFSAATENEYYLTVSDALNSIEKTGGELQAVTGANNVKEVVTIDGTAYFLTSLNDVDTLMKNAEDGAQTVLNSLDQKLTGLTAFNGKLFVLVGNKLNRVDTETGSLTQIADVAMESYAIVDSFVYFANGDDKLQYEKNSLTGSEMLTREAGCLYKLNLLTNEVSIVLELGISDIKAGSDCLYFHNLNDCYVMGSGSSEWLEGKIYSCSLTGENVTPVTTGYDWGFYPVSNGVAVYTMQDISLYPANGGAKVQLMTPEVYTSIAQDGDKLIVYERTNAALTILSVDGSAPVSLIGNSSAAVVETAAADDTAETENTEKKETVSAVSDLWLDDTATSKSEANAGSSKDTSSSDSKSSGKKSGGYIFPNSNKKKLTKSDILAVDYDLWAYGRNEILARHGYKFSKSIYANYFAKKSWYTAGGYNEKDVTSVEWYNMDLLKKMEAEYKSSGNKGKGGDDDGGDVKGTVTATGGDTNIRSSNNKDSKILGVLKKGKSVSYLGEAKKDSRGVKWYKVKYKDQVGWVSSKYTTVK